MRGGGVRRFIFENLTVPKDFSVFLKYISNVGVILYALTHLLGVTQVLLCFCAFYNIMLLMSANLKG